MTTRIDKDQHQSCGNCDAHHMAEPFTRPMHFFLALLPVGLGVAYFLIKCATTPASPIVESLLTGPMRAVWVQDSSVGFHLFFFLAFVFGIGSGLGLIKAVNQLEGCRSE